MRSIYIVVLTVVLGVGAYYATTQSDGEIFSYITRYFTTTSPAGEKDAQPSGAAADNTPDEKNSVPSAADGATDAADAQTTDGAPAPDTAPSDGTDGGQNDAPADSAAQPASPDGATPSDTQTGADNTQAVIKGTLRKGDTMGKLLEDWANSTDVQRYLNATNPVFPLRSFRAGHPYVLVCDLQSGSVKRFEYEIDNNRKLVVEGDGKDTVARVEKINYDVSLALLEGTIEDNLFKSVADLGESPQLALLIAQLFGWEVNFIRDIQDGDSFSILVEKLYREGEYKGYGRTLGATFTNKGKTYEAFLFNDANGQSHYYNSRGENLKKTLLQAPLSFTRVTSGYTKSRKHPIFGTHRAHFGVDYGAPTGTPVKAVGDGIVTLRGWVGGYGNQVVIKHSGGLESMYSHLSGFARGLSKGGRVRQGQVIAYVGSTGYSTGPHLDFRLKQNGEFVNPTKAINPRSEPVSRGMQQAFNQRKDFVRSFMLKQRNLSDFTPSMIAAAAEQRDVQKEKPQVRKKSDPPRKKQRSTRQRRKSR